MVSGVDGDVAGQDEWVIPAGTYAVAGAEENREFVVESATEL